MKKMVINMSYEIQMLERDIEWEQKKIEQAKQRIEYLKNQINIFNGKHKVCLTPEQQLNDTRCPSCG